MDDIHTRYSSLISHPSFFYTYTHSHITSHLAGGNVVSMSPLHSVAPRKSEESIVVVPSSELTYYPITESDIQVIIVLWVLFLVTSIFVGLRLYSRVKILQFYALEDYLYNMAFVSFYFLLFLNLFRTVHAASHHSSSMSHSYFLLVRWRAGALFSPNVSVFEMKMFTVWNTRVFPIEISETSGQTVVLVPRISISSSHDSPQNKGRDTSFGPQKVHSQK